MAKFTIFKETEERGTFYFAYFNTEHLLGVEMLRYKETEEQCIERLKNNLFYSNLNSVALEEKMFANKKLVSIINLY
jgi:uncharacterized protein YegP (UPF0339 family)